MLSEAIFSNYYPLDNTKSLNACLLIFKDIFKSELICSSYFYRSSRKVIRSINFYYSDNYYNGYVFFYYRTVGVIGKGMTDFLSTEFFRVKISDEDLRIVFARFFVYWLFTANVVVITDFIYKFNQN